MNKSIKQYIKKTFPQLFRLRETFRSIRFLYLQAQDPRKFGYRGAESQIYVPAHISNPRNVYMYEQTRLQGHSKIITYTGKFIMKKYAGAAPGLTVITGNHTPTVGIPHFSLVFSRINDHEQDVIVEEDAWLGANVTLLPGVTIGRGAVVGACSVVTKNVPPYAVVVGNPARIIASKFTLEEVIRHESQLYPEEERLNREYLTGLFAMNFQGKRSIGKPMSEENREQYDRYLETFKK